MSQIITPQPLKKNIDDLDFVTIPFGAYYALGLLGRIGKSASSEGLDPSSKLSGQVMGMLDQSLVLELFKQTHVWMDDGGDKGPRKVEIMSQGAFDKVFNGRLPTMFKVIEFVLEANFGAFQDGSKSEPAAPVPQDS